MNPQFEHSDHLIKLLPEVAAHGMQSFDRLAVLALEALRVQNIEGDVVEMGCHAGGTARWLRELLPHKKLWLYDTFEGQPEDGPCWKKGDMKGDRAALDSFPPPFVITEVDICAIHKRPDVLLPEKICLCHLDVDNFEATLEGLKLVCPRMVTGGVLILDDCEDPRFPGVKQAAEEYQATEYFSFQAREAELGCGGLPIASAVFVKE